MAAGTVSYQAPQYGSLASAVGEKIGSAIKLAAGARRNQNEEIKSLKDIPEEERTDEQKGRLKELLEQKESQGKGFFFKKALGTEFGGDRRRRTMGFFQRDPADQNDPALDKKKRFEALLRAQPAGVQKAPDAPPETPVTRQDGGILGSFATGIIEKISLLSKKVDDLKKTEAEDKTPSAVVKLSESVRNIKTFFNKNNSIEEERIKISRESLAEQKKSADKAEASEIENRGESRDRRAGLAGIDNRRDGGEGKGILGTLFDFGMDLLSGRRRGNRPSRRRRSVGSFFPSRRRRRSVGGTAYSAPIGPQPLNSSTPWAAKSPGERGGMFGQGGFSPRLPARKLASGGVVSTPKGRSKGLSKPPEKLADGAVLDNPTKFGDSAVVPKSDMVSAVKQDSGNAKKAPLYAKLTDVSIAAIGGAMISKVSSFIGGLSGGVGKIFRPIIQRLFLPAAAAFGLPVNLITAMFGGEASAQGMSMHGAIPTRGGNGKNGTGNATNAASTGNTAGISGAAFATNVGSISGYGVSSGFGSRVHPITGEVKEHLGTDYGIPYGEPISLKMGGKVGTGAADFKAPDTSGSVSGIVTIDHPDGNSTRYVHLSKVNVRPGEEVRPGQVIGEVGGRPGSPGGGGSTAEHLHFEYYPGGNAPADGVHVADKYFGVGGDVTAVATPTTPTTPISRPAAPSSPTPPGSAARTTGGREPIVLSSASPPPAQPLQPTGRSNLPVDNDEYAYDDVEMGW
jgi:murein DD-endopeptidase MepM/ murein hydrolase activator NlpD